MKKSLIVLISILALLVIIIGYGISINNKMVNADEAVMSQWAKVENQYQRRADLIPNLVNTVKGYASHEKETLDAVVNARAKATQVTISPDNLNEVSLQKYQAAQGTEPSFRAAVNGNGELSRPESKPKLSGTTSTT